MIGTIYALCDPDGAFRYVGQTTLDPERRFRYHLRPDSSPKGRWIAELEASGTQPKLVILEADVPASELRSRERAWIVKLRAEGHNLTNAVGPGAFCSPETRAKRSRALKGRAWSVARRASEERRERRPLSPESRARLSAALRGKRPTSEVRQKLKDAKAADRATPRICPLCQQIQHGSLGLSVHCTKAHRFQVGRLIRLARRANPEKADAFLEQIKRNDSEIQRLLGELASS